MIGDRKRLAGLRVLIVDDERSIVKLLQMMLQDMGVNQVFTAKDGAEALKFLGECEDLVNTVICDWNMPKMTGIELLRQVRSVDASIQFIMVTGKATVDAVKEARSLHVNAYIAKPFHADQIRQKLEIVANNLQS